MFLKKKPHNLQFFEVFFLYTKRVLIPKPNCGLLKGGFLFPFINASHMNIEKHEGKKKSSL
jgi:hypothetical protein